MTADEKEKVAVMLTATLEICASAWSDNAFEIAMVQLARFPAQQVLGALQRCQLELTGRLSLAAIVERIDDGRPGGNEAWAIVGTDSEAATIVATEEAWEAWGEVARCKPGEDASLLARDKVAARMSFLEIYARLVRDARSAARPVHWRPSLGQDPSQREQALRSAVEQGRLAPAEVAGLLPAAEPARALPARSEESMLEEGRRKLSAIRSALGEQLGTERQAQRRQRIDWQAEEVRLAAREAG